MKKVIILLLIFLFLGSSYGQGIPFDFNPLGTQISTFTPFSLSPLAWYDASDTTTILKNGTAVTNWLDKSGNSYHAWQTTITNQPTTTIFNGVNAINIGSDDFLMTSQINILTGLDNITYIALSTSIFAQGGGDLGNWSIQFHTGNSAIVLTNPPPATQYSAAIAHGSGIITTIIDQTGAQLIKRIINGGASSKETTLTRTGIRASARGFMLGRGDTIYYPGIIGEVLVFKRVLSVSEYQKAEGYLAWKWGVAYKLPIDHPYKNAPPLK